MSTMQEYSEDDLERVYAWIDQVPLSRQKKCIARDFSDGVLMAELLKRYYPRLVDLHNYVPANSIAKKLDNWFTLNHKVFAKLGIKLDQAVIRGLANSQGGFIEKVLMDLRERIIRECSAQSNYPFAEFEVLDERSKENDLDEGDSANSREPESNVIPRQAFHRLKRELAEKSEVMNKLQEKVDHLEKLLKLKDERISDLLARTVKSTDGN